MVSTGLFRSYLVTGNFATPETFTGLGPSVCCSVTRPELFNPFKMTNLQLRDHLDAIEFQLEHQDYLLKPSDLPFQHILIQLHQMNLSLYDQYDNNFPTIPCKTNQPHNLHGEVLADVLLAFIWLRSFYFQARLYILRENPYTQPDLWVVSRNGFFLTNWFVFIFTWPCIPISPIQIVVINIIKSTAQIFSFSRLFWLIFSPIIKIDFRSIQPCLRFHALYVTHSNPNIGLLDNFYIFW